MMIKLINSVLELFSKHASLFTYILIITTITLTSFDSNAQIKAFPDAEGFGAFTTGGRGGDVWVVTNLEDNPESAPEGSLRWAVRKKGARTIVFAVSGNIDLKAPLDINNGNLTIAGQTAPGDGICIRNYTVRVKADNVIIRYLRLRCGNLELASAAQDAMNAIGTNQVIIDHCSMSWSIDETGSFYDNKNFTLQWCILSESLYAAGHSKGNHGFGGIWGGEGASFHHNLIANHTSRNPRFNGARFASKPETELVDFRNNVIFNWGYQSIYGGESGSYNMINNYFKPGPATKKESVRYRILDLTQEYTDKKVRSDTVKAGKFYVAGNKVEGYENASNDNWQFGVQKATEEQKKVSYMKEPFQVSELTTQNATEAYQLVLSKAGAILPKRDTIDARIVNETKTGICAYGGSYGEKTGIIDTQNTVGGWPELKTYNIKTDKDKDGMTDDWELANGLNPNDASDRNGDLDLDGYTNLEEYLNSLVLIIKP
jgi:hypothetical protein